MGMTILRVKSQKVDKLTENIEKSLRYLGKAMQCAEGLSGEEDYNERKGWDDEEDDMDERNDMRRGGRESSNYRNRYGRY